MVKDMQGDRITLNMYNQVDKWTKPEPVAERYSIGTRIGIKNPYILVSMSGIRSMRNDNCYNITFY